MKNSFLNLIKNNVHVTCASFIWILFIVTFGCAAYLQNHAYISQDVYISMQVFNFAFVFLLVFFGCDSSCKADCQKHAPWLKPTHADIVIIASFILFVMVLMYLNK